jgi:limonene-1,2-epoxide hydrolase
MDQRAMTELEVVEEFLRALEALDIDRALELLDPNVLYQNVPFPPARGIRAVEKQLRGLGRFASAFEARNHNIASNGPIVLTERTDVVAVGRMRAAFWVCGTFEVHDGRITVWRDRFDFVDVLWACVRGAVRAAVPRS